MRKLTLLITTLLSISYGKARTNPDHTPILIHYISKQCGIDSTVVANTVMRLHKTFKVKRVEFVVSATNANYYLPGGVLRMNYADTARMCEMWTAELAHAEQFSLRPVKYGLLTIRDGIKTIGSLLFLTPTERLLVRDLRAKQCSWLKARFWAVWQRTYRRPGTMEYDAHEVIEKKLTEIISKLLFDPPIAGLLLY
jgi:hypothetical protein